MILSNKETYEGLIDEQTASPTGHETKIIIRPSKIGQKKMMRLRGLLAHGLDEMKVDELDTVRRIRVGRNGYRPLERVLIPQRLS